MSKQFSLAWIPSLKAKIVNSKPQLSSIWSIDRTLPGATTPGHSGLGSNGNEGVLHIPQISSITETPPSDFLVSYPGHSFGGGSNPSAEVHSVYSTAPANWAIERDVLNTLPIKRGINSMLNLLHPPPIFLIAF